jgi:hypothetical protein
MTISLLDIATKVALFLIVLFGGVLITKLMIKWSDSKKKD